MHADEPQAIAAAATDASRFGLHSNPAQGFGDDRPGGTRGGRCGRPAGRIITCPFTPVK